MSRTNKHWEKAQAIADRYELRLLDFMFSITRNEDLAEKAVDNTLNKVYDNEELCEKLWDDAWAYLSTTAVNEWRTILRKKKSEGRTEAGYNLLYAEQWEESHEEAIVERELQDQLEVLIRKLPEREGEVFASIRQGQSTKEIAERLNISEQTVRNTKTNAIKRLKDELGRLGLLHLLWLWL
jgi:RNA polymerase sigma factor (sigma-70 family)